MRCHYHYHEELGQKILIPGCWGTVHSGNMEDCHCGEDFVSYKHIERKEYSEKLEKCNKDCRSGKRNHSPQQTR